ncbi:MAG: hypothetical protein JNL74_14055, partial [Fibrobacteres bacterium]|nr:hypothetical protein [Fibrobacterota bacterium]
VNERAGSIVAIMVNDSISSLISNEVNRFKIDLENEGYTTILREVSKSVKAETLWNMLRREYSVPGRFMAGAVLIGKFPTESNSETGEKTDCVYWNMAGPYKNTNTLNIWVSRISTQGLSLPRGRMDEVSRLKEALDANHRYRTGLSRLPHTGYWWALPEFMDCYPKNGATILEMLPDSQFLKPIDAIQKGGELLDETSHTTSHGIGNLWYHPTQIRFALLTSCGQSQNAQEQIFGRGGGCVLSVGATQTTYTGAFQIIDDRSDSVFRFQLANGESFGSALVTQYAFNDRYRAMFYGDLSLRMKMAAANRVPSVSSITANVTAGRAPLTVQFSTSATDPDGDPISVYEWWPENYCGVNEPALSGTTTSLSHVYRVPHLYKAEVLVKDSYGACGWLTKDIAVAPEPGKPLRINCGFPYTGSSTLTSYYVPFGDYVDKDGNTWLHDQSYTNGTWGKIAKDNQLMLSGSVANTEDDSLFLSYARDVSAKTGIEYKIPLPDGAYTLRLGFADMSNSEVGKRIMDISAEGNVLENSFDIVAAFGAKTAGFISKAIELKDGMLDILIKTSASSPSGVSGYAIVNCIEIVPQGSTFSEKSILAEPEFNVHQQLNVLHLSLNNGSKERDDADIAIYSIRGQLLQRIVVNNKILASGIDCGSTWPCGMYYVKARVGKRLFMKSAVLVR